MLGQIFFIYFKYQRDNYVINAGFGISNYNESLLNIYAENSISVPIKVKKGQKGEVLSIMQYHLLHRCYLKSDSYYFPTGKKNSVYTKCA